MPCVTPTKMTVWPGQQHGGDKWNKENHEGAQNRGRRTFQSYGKEEAIQSKAWGTEATVGMRRDAKT